MATVEVKYATKNPCYQSGRKNSLKGICIHSVGCPQPNPDVFANLWNSASAEVCVHYVSGASKIVQLLPDDTRAWHCGSGPKGSGNDMYISIEIPEPNTIEYISGSNFIDKNPAESKKHVLAAYATTVELAASLCNEYGFNPLDKKELTSHSELHEMGYASNHGDPAHLFSRYGLSMDGFRQDVKKKMDGGGSVTPTPTPTPDTKYYRVRKSWADASSQLGAFVDINGAKTLCNANPGYSVFDWNGNVVYTNGGNAGSSNTSYMVKVTADALNVRSGAGTQYGKTGCIRDQGCYTIVETSGNWGKLKSGLGWICLDYTVRI